MRYTPEIQAKIVAQIEASPDAEVILPAWAYHAGSDQPVVYIDSMPVRLARVLYEHMIGALPEGAGLMLNPGVHRRNVNPHLFTPTASPHTRLQCPNKHPYREEDWTPRGHRCRECRRAKNLGRPTVAEINAAKTHCPQDHPLVGDNLIQLKSGRRRCRQCHRETQARYRARKESS